MRSDSKTQIEAGGSLEPTETRSTLSAIWTRAAAAADKEHTVHCDKQRRTVSTTKRGI